MNILIGADPEFFVVKGKKIVCIHETNLPGTKNEPCAVTNGAVQQDGYAAEYNVTPANNPNNFADVISEVRNNLMRIIPNYKPCTKTSTIFRKAYMETMPPHVNELGCDPDFCAWKDGEMNPRPKAGNMRTVGGHVHIGTEDIKGKEIEVIKACDLFLGIPSLLIDPDTKRRSMYGKAGSYRIKPYGVEYRTLSNFWIWNPEHCKTVFNNAIIAVKWALSGKGIPEYVESVINSSDVQSAEEICIEFGIPTFKN